MQLEHVRISHPFRFLTFSHDREAFDFQRKLTEHFENFAGGMDISSPSGSGGRPRATDMASASGS